MSNPSNIRRDAAAAVAQLYSLPSVEGPLVGRRMSEKDEDEIEKLKAKGYEDGLAAARREVDAQLAQMRAKMQKLDIVLNSLAKPFEELDKDVEQQLTLLALTVGKQMVRRELRTDPAQVVGVIRECVGRLPAAAREVRVYLHPQDAAVVRDVLAEPTHDRAWQVVEDPTITRGGCVVRSETSQIDARLDARLNAIVAAAFGDERAPGREAQMEPAE